MMYFVTQLQNKKPGINLSKGNSTDVYDRARIPHTTRSHNDVRSSCLYIAKSVGGMRVTAVGTGH